MFSGKLLLSLLLYIIGSSGGKPYIMYCIDGVDYFSNGVSENGDMKAIYSTSINVWYFQPIPSEPNGRRLECIQTGSELTECTKVMWQDDIGTVPKLVDVKDISIKFGFCGFPDTFCVKGINFIRSETNGRYYTTSEESQFKFFYYDELYTSWSLVGTSYRWSNDLWECVQSGLILPTQCTAWALTDTPNRISPSITSGEC